MECKYTIPNLGKAMKMLKVLTSAENGITAVELEKVLAIPRTTAFRILKTLAFEGMIEKKGTRFYAGPGLMEIGVAALRRSQLREMAVPILHDLTRESQLTSHLAIPSGWHSLLIEVCDSPDPVRVASRPGTLADLHCSATGKLFLAYLWLDELDEFFETIRPQRRTSNTLVSPEQMRKEICKIRRLGYAVDEREYHPTVRCLAAPVRSYVGQVVAAIGVTGPSAIFTAMRIEEIAGYVCAAANKLSANIGHAGN